MDARIEALLPLMRPDLRDHLLLYPILVGESAYRISCSETDVVIGPLFWEHDVFDRVILLEHEARHLIAAHPQRMSYVQRILNLAPEGCGLTSREISVMCNAMADLVVDRYLDADTAHRLDLYQAGRAPFAWIPGPRHPFTFEQLVWSYYRAYHDSPLVDRMPVVLRFGDAVHFAPDDLACVTMNFREVLDWSLNVMPEPDLASGVPMDWDPIDRGEGTTLEILH